MGIAQKLDLIKRNQCDFLIQRISFTLNQHQIPRQHSKSEILLTSVIIIIITQFLYSAYHCHCVSMRCYNQCSIITLALAIAAIRRLCISRNIHSCQVPIHLTWVECSKVRTNFLLKEINAMGGIRTADPRVER